MGIGKMVPLKFQEFADRKTGRRVKKLTPDGTLAHHPYFYNKIFTRDDRCIVAVMDMGEGRQLFLLDILQETARQLTEAKEIGDFTPMLSRDDHFLFYNQGRSFIKLDLDTLAAQVLYTVPQAWMPGAPALSTDNRYAVMAELYAEDCVQGNGTWDTFEPQWKRMPRTRLVVLDIETQKAQTIHDEQYWLGHAQFRPGSNTEVSYCHEGPAHCIDARLWMINTDGTNRRCLRQQEKNELITHEFWYTGGSYLSYVYRKLSDASGVNAAAAESKDKIKQSVMRICPEKGVEEAVMETSVYCHFITDEKNSRVVGDGQNQQEPYLFIADLYTKREEIICCHDTAWKTYGNTQDAHPHPLFNHAGTQILFTSDRDGLPGIYLTSALEESV